MLGLGKTTEAKAPHSEDISRIITSRGDSKRRSMKKKKKRMNSRKLPDPDNITLKALLILKM